MQPRRAVENVLQNIVERVLGNTVLQFPYQFLSHHVAPNLRKRAIQRLEPGRETVQLPSDIAEREPRFIVDQPLCEGAVLAGFDGQTSHCKDQRKGSRSSACILGP